jgi:PAS domain S-box-containing protein
MPSSNASTEARQRALLAAIPDLMFRLRRDGTYLEFAGDTSRLATPHGDLIGSNMFDILPHEVAEVFMEGVGAALDAGELQSVEYELRRLAGDVRDFEARIVPVPDAADEVVAIVRDVTKERELALDLLESRRRAVKASDRERRRFERDLHDGAQQRLTTANLHLHVALRALETNPAASRGAIETAQRELAAGIREIRELVRGLQPAVLAADGLAAAITSLVERSSIPVDLEDLPDDRLPEPVERALYYFVSEALANATKYSRARRVAVSIRVDSEQIDVVVRDDGIGGVPLDSTGGIAGFRERIGAVGGTFAIESPAGVGTTLSATIPRGSER